jgi:lipopolysaccharide export system protein LptA
MKSLIAMASVALAAGAVACGAASPAAAQLSRNPKAPIDITADQLETHNADCVSVWTGSAEALQDTSRLRADVLTARMEVKKTPKAAGAAPSTGSGNCGDLLSINAKGSVYYVSSDGRRVHGDEGVYDASSTTITITGDVVAVDGQNVMRGTRMVYNTQTGEGRVEGGAKGPAAKNRPRGVFYPKESNDQSQGTSTGTSATALASPTAPSGDKAKKAPK